MTRSTTIETPGPAHGRSVCELPDKHQFPALIAQILSKSTFGALPEGLTKIEDYTFHGCTKNAIKKIPASVKSIGAGAFQSNSSLTEITFEGTPTSIAKNAFNGCTQLTTINVPWSQGTVANAPWGAPSNVKINYKG